MISLGTYRQTRSRRVGSAPRARQSAAIATISDGAVPNPSSTSSAARISTVDDQLVILDHNYFPAYVALAEANIRSVEESAYGRRLLLTVAERPDNALKVEDLRQRIASAGKASDDEIAAARQRINEQIADPLDFDDNVALARLDVRIESLQEERRRYEAVLSKLLAAAEVGNKMLATELLGELDHLRDDFDRKIEAARSEMRRLAGAAIVGTRAYQKHWFRSAWCCWR
jgi:hypothetical protein